MRNYALYREDAGIANWETNEFVTTKKSLVFPTGSQGPKGFLRIVPFYDQAFKPVSLYDGLGRTFETRNYDTGSAYLTSKQEFDEFGWRASKRLARGRGETGVIKNVAFSTSGIANPVNYREDTATRLSSVVWSLPPHLKLGFQARFRVADVYPLRRSLVTWHPGWDNQRPARVPSKPSPMEALPEQLVAEFLSAYRTSQDYLRDHIRQLAEMAADEDGQVAEPATRALFTSLVERLADSFEPDAVSLYNRAFAQVIQICRRNPRAGELDQELEELGLRGEEDLVARANKLRQVSGLTDTIDPGRIRRVIVLSRVTLGADVAITSVIIERIKRKFTGAEIVLVGGTKTSELFGGDPRIRFKLSGYRRAGTTIERLLTWIDLLRCVRDVTNGLRPGEYLIADPDTRLTQLGLLPIARADLRGRSSDQLERDFATQIREYMFFPSREYGSGTPRSLSELTSSWLDEVFNEHVPTYPQVSVRRDDIEVARNLMNRIKRGSRPVIALNFGVGDNQLKRVGGDFEASLVSCLIREGAAIVLDKGAGADEVTRADAVVGAATRIEREGRRVRAVEINEQSLTEEQNSGRLDAEILVWNGRIGMLAGLIGESDLYIGYDSAGQHIAAALGVRCIDVFAGFSSQRMIERWRPSGRAETRIVAVDTVSGGRATSDVLFEVLSYARQILVTSREAN